MAYHYYINTVVSLIKNIEQSYVNNLTKGKEISSYTELTNAIKTKNKRINKNRVIINPIIT